MAQTRLFRQSALDRLATPEQLDRALFTTTTKGWLALVMLTLIAAAVGIWSVVGEISSFVPAQGIFLNRGGKIIGAVATGTGVLNRLTVTVGDKVEKGAVVAMAVNEQTMERYRSALALIRERRTALDDFRASEHEEGAITDANVAKRRTRLELLEESSRNSVEVARKRLADHRRLYEERVVTRLTVERSQQAFDRVQRELFNTLRERDELESAEVRRRNDRRTRLADMEARLRAAESSAQELSAALNTQDIIAPEAGIITEVKVDVGSTLSPGREVLSISTGAENLEVLVYVAPVEGKKVKPGMDVLVSPSTLRREVYGSIRGKVDDISPFPVSLEGMIAVLENRNLAQTFSSAGPPYASRITLVPDPSTVSGFSWTSKKAANERLSSGTLATVEVKVDSQPPIALVIPLIRETFGL